MKTKKLIFVFFGVLSLIFGTLSGLRADESGIFLSTSTIRPGDLVQIKVKAPPEAKVRTIFLGVKKQLLFYSAGTFIGMLASSYYTKPGNYPLAVEIIQDQGNTTAMYQIEVTGRQFQESRIWVPEADRKTILTDENRESDTKAAQEARQKTQLEPVLPLWREPFIWPLKGRLTTGFGLIRYVNNIENGRHSGLDIAAPSGTPVAAINDGQVVLAQKLYLTGLTVVVYHGLDLFSTYGHLSAFKVKEGDFVSKGDIIGLVGATGLATGPHLHLTLRVGEIAVDPYLFLDKNPGWEF
ncbi:MAG: M23 family metallopeptidase [Firmicutes bacterium]|nr:M23 family metallopeptidase [Bacillota bacterium]